MASVKVRSRRGGAAIPLDETDKQLLNLMQGRFDLVRAPVRARGAARRARGGRGAHAREAPARPAHHPRDHADLRHAGARATPRCWSPRRSTRRSRTAPRKVINTHPGVTHNYLRNHDFNLWFTIAIEPDSKLGLQGTLDVLQERTGAESIRQLPTLKLFKIRMDLEMEQGTDALAAAGEAKEPMELEPIELSDDDVATIRATQGPMPVVTEPYAPAAERLGVSQEDVLARLESLRERGGLRRVAAILFHRRAGFSANGMGVWKVPEGEELDIGRRMAAFRGISHCYQRPTYADWPYSIFTMAHGRSREECDAILDSIAADTGIDERATLYSSTEFKKVRMIYFTDAFRPLGAGARALSPARSPTPARPSCYRRALQVLPGGVNSPVRAMRAIGRDPIFIERGDGAEIFDVDGNVYVDYVCSWGPLIHGHAHPAILEAVAEAAAAGTTFGAPTAGEVELAELVASRMPAVDMLRMTSSGTEASMSAIRLARAATGREQVLKFAGAYHGHVDGLLAEAGSGLATQGIPSSPGVPAAAAAQTVIVPWNDPEAVRRAFAEHELAAVLCEPYPANMGLVPPQAGFLELLRELCSGAPARCSSSTRSSPASACRAGRGAGADRRAARPDRDGQGARRRAAGRRLRRVRAADEPRRAGRRRLPGRHAERQPARRGRRPRRAGAARRAGLPAALGHDARARRGAARGRRATARCRSRTRPAC